MNSWQIHGKCSLRYVWAFCQKIFNAGKTKLQVYIQFDSGPSPNGNVSANYNIIYSDTFIPIYQAEGNFTVLTFWKMGPGL